MKTILAILVLSALCAVAGTCPFCGADLTQNSESKLAVSSPGNPVLEFAAKCPKCGAEIKAVKPPVVVTNNVDAQLASALSVKSATMAAVDPMTVSKRQHGQGRRFLKDCPVCHISCVSTNVSSSGGRSNPDGSIVREFRVNFVCPALGEPFSDRFEETVQPTKMERLLPE